MKDPSTPIVADMVRLLDPDLRENYEERAAIMQFEGGLACDHAEALALLDVLRRYPDALSALRAYRLTRGGVSRYLLSTTQRLRPERLIALGYEVTPCNNIAAVLDEHFNGLAEMKALAELYGLRGTRPARRS